ncbi:MAG: RsmB/NOP family class I SAM-dependent RNA methyltransferase [Litorimonas sp.]
MTHKPSKKQASGEGRRPKAQPARVQVPVRDSVKTRRAAAMALQDILKNGTVLEQALSSLADYNELSSRDRAFARAIVATTFRRFAQIQGALKPLIRKAPPSFTLSVLQTAAAQILFLKTPAHAAVGETVDVLKSRSSSKGFANMANAVLRNLVKDGAKRAANVAPSANIPGWIRSAWEKSYGKVELRKMAARLMKDPVLDLYVNGDVQLWADKLEGTVIGTQTVRLQTIGDVTALDGFTDGHWWAQDIAATLPAQLAKHFSHGLAGKTVLDLCAAPGGKTLQLATMGAEVTALDRSEKRLTRLSENLERTKLSAHVVCADALEWNTSEKFDVILLDAPCSATGTFRRHPDVLYNRTPKMVSDLTKLQDKLLKSAVKWLKDDGILIYSVCSLQPEESGPRVNRFLRDLPDFRLISIPHSICADLGLELPKTRFEGGTLRSLPSDLPTDGGMDGFFIAVFTRKTEAE